MRAWPENPRKNKLVVQKRQRGYPRSTVESTVKNLYLTVGSTAIFRRRKGIISHVLEEDVSQESRAEKIKLSAT